MSAQLNCKQGDTAIVVHSVADNEGKIVTCVRLISNPGVYYFLGPRWVIDESLFDSCGDPIYSLADVALRPLNGLENREFEPVAVFA